MPPVRFDRLSEQEDRLRQSGYRQLEPFFVLREGFIQDNRSGGVLHLNKARLEKIAAIQNQRVEHTGDFTPIIIGHTKKNKKENEQPELTGYASRFNVVPFLDGKTWGLQAVPWSRPEKIENFEKFPRRSAELWTDPDLLDPISLLGANTPRLDLGLHRLQRDVSADDLYVPRHNRIGTPLYLEMDMADDNEPKGDSGGSGGGGSGGSGNGGGGGGSSGGGNSALSAVFNSPEWKQMQETISQFAEIAQVLMPMIQEMNAGGGGGGGGPGAMPPGAPSPGGATAAAPPPPEVPAQMSGHPMHYAGHPMQPPMGQHMHQTAPPPVHPPQHHLNMGGGGVAPGGTNVQIPHQMDRTGGQFSSVEQELAYLRQLANAQQQQLAAMQLSMIETTVNGVLDDLEEKVTIDRPRDFNRLVRLSRADMDAEVAFMLQTRKPVEQPTPPEGVPLQFQAAGGQPGATRGPMGPIQMSLSQAHDMLQMPPDPTMAGPAPAPQSNYDKLMDVVRNRNRGESAMDAYHRVMGKTNGQAGANGTAVRG